jgi:hypothetical protein
MKHFTGFSGGFTELHTKLDADKLLDFTIAGKMKHEVEKALM